MFDADPEDWREASFASLAEYANGRAFKPEDWREKGLPIIRIAQITNPGSETDFYDGPVEPRHLIEDGDLIFSWSATLAVVSWTGGPAVLNQHLFKVTPVEGIDRNWLQYRLEASIPDLADEAHGTTMKHIRKGTLSSKTTRVPPFDEQQRIAEVLRSVDDAISISEAQTTQCGFLLTSFSDHLLKDESEHVPLRELFDFKNGINFDVSDRGDEGTLTLDVMNMYSDDLTPTYSGAYRIARSVPSDLLINNGDLLFVRSSVRQEGVGWVALADGFDEPTTFCGFIIRARRISERIEPRFAAYLLRATSVRRWLVQHSTRSALTNINQKTLGSLTIPVPALEQQRQAIQQLHAIEVAGQVATANLRHLRMLRRNIANDLLSGRVRVPA